MMTYSSYKGVLGPSPTVEENILTLFRPMLCYVLDNIHHSSGYDWYISIKFFNSLETGEKTFENRPLLSLREPVKVLK